MLLLEVEPVLKWSRASIAINVLDRSLGLFLGTASVPIVIGSATVIALLSRRSPFIAHLRVGRQGTSFWVWKLRTMWDRNSAAEQSFAWVERIIAEPEREHKAPEDSRVTNRFAAFCRRHSIDELPQFWQVVRGEMSLVGPRPLTRTELDRHYGSHAAEVLSVKPGLTGLWQIQGRSAIQFPMRAAMDVELARDRSLGTYVKILVRTIPAVLGGEGAW